MTQPVELLPPLEIMIRGREETTGYACPVCGVLWMFDKDDTDELKENHYKAAKQHCQDTCACGGKLEKYWTMCKDCREKAAVAKEKERFEEAEKIPVSDYGDPVNWSDHSGDMTGEGFFSNTEAVIEYCEEEGFELPAYVWACKRYVFTLDADSILSQQMEQQDMFEDAIDCVPQADYDRLAAFLKDWSKGLDLVTWMVDFSRAIVLEPRPPKVNDEDDGSAGAPSDLDPHRPS
jgi:hypothetical protein